MAAYMRSVIRLVAIERNAFLTRGSSVIEESKRYVRGLRRTPVRVLTEKVLKPQCQPAGLNVPASDRDSVKERDPKPTETETPSKRGIPNRLLVLLLKSQLQTETPSKRGIPNRLLVRFTVLRITSMDCASTELSLEIKDWRG
ncbi:hypothetical protein EPR50_G00022260 [Perca flavescens]|uniref:Uncharacterized protein n=1 Tax=Perca flavescens TaxID=8167 RepID=A0A484DH87_PERFV|nr:hypothetical protein EPR50_G00022260 [Perca flavescens]